MRKPLLGALVALSALLGLLAGCASSSTGAPPSGPARSTVTQALVGTWRPLAIAGYTAPAQFVANVARATLSFAAGGSWRGSDGCNEMSGTYRVGDGGTFSATAGPQTEIGCANVPNAQVVTGATALSVEGDTLTFLDRSGAVLGTYQRVTG